MRVLIISPPKKTKKSPNNHDYPPAHFTFITQLFNKNILNVQKKK